MKIISFFKNTALIFFLCGGMIQYASAQLTITGNAQLISSGSNTQIVLQNLGIVNNATMNHTSGTVKFSGNSSNSISGNGTMNFYNLELAKSTGISLSLSRNINVSQQIQFTSGLLDLNGYNITLASAAGLVNENETSRIIGPNGGYISKVLSMNAPPAANPGNLGAIITSSQNLGSVTIQRGHQAQLNVAGGNSILRYYNILPENNSSLNATLRFKYFDAELNGNSESTLNLYKSTDNVNWTSQAFTSRDASANYVEKTGINDFSKWTLRSSNGIIICDFVFYRDADGDGYGDPAISVGGCEPVDGYVANNTDCNDDPNNGGAAVHPGAAELCNGIDDDCDGLIDENLQSILYYLDADGDGYGDPANSITSCEKPDGYVANNTDCNDNSASINPAASEICGNSIDDNCNDQTDEDCTNSTPLITINDIIVNESAGTAQLTVILSAPSANTVKVNYKTLNGTAMHPKDYLRSTGEIVFAPGTTTKFIIITIVADNKAETDEYFDVQLITPQGATIGDNNGRITITESLITRVSSQKKTTQDHLKEHFDVKVSSNPTHSRFRLDIESNKEEVVAIQISDVQGKIIQRIQAHHPFQPIFLGTNYRPGIYFAQIIQGANRKTVKLIKL